MMLTFRIIVPPLLTRLSSLYRLSLSNSRAPRPHAAFHIAAFAWVFSAYYVVLINDPAKSSAELVTCLHNGLLPCDCRRLSSEGKYVASFLRWWTNAEWLRLSTIDNDGRDCEIDAMLGNPFYKHVILEHQYPLQARKKHIIQ